MKTKLFLFLAFFAMLFSANAQVTSVALVGEAAGGWPTGAVGEVDAHHLTSTDGENWTLTNVVLTTAAAGGGVKFRANDAWTINWGSAAWPSGTGTQEGANILSIAGSYDVTFNSTTGAYSFVGGTPIPIVKLIGTCLAPATELLMATTDGNIYTATTVLAAGNAQFEFNDNAAVPTITTIGGTTFPTGPTSEIITNFIPVTAGNYVVSINLNDGTYSFVAVNPIINIALVGAATPIGWPNYPDPATEDLQKMSNKDNANENYYFGELPLTVAGLKFRANKGWTDSWGGVAFPSGPTAGNNGDILVTTAGTYSVEFVRSTGAYNFFTPKIGLIGNAIGGWGDSSEINLDTTDGITYSKNNVVVVANDGCKFRLDNRWTKAWGSTVFPSGVSATTVGGNIPATTGTYYVTFNRLTGDFSFGPVLANATFVTKNFTVSPNPSNDSWKIVSGSNQITAVEVVNVLGKVVYSNNSTSNEVVVDATNLSNGVYFAKVTAANATETIKLVKN
jgi:starch-binding outer membrane protein SusE/F